jgi:RNA ligase (TIGR02306 family)
MRKLASIQKIKALEPIENADAIERATVLGWQLVVKKGDFGVGDLCVYCEIDSLMPDRPEFEFLKPRGMRIRTVRLRGQISQGISFPLSILPPMELMQEDMDVTELLGITKYEPPIPACLAGKIKGKIPSFVPKSDETRVQVLQNVLDKYKGEQFFITEKLDGNSATYYVKDGEFGVCSRNLDLLEDENNSFWKVARKLNIEEKLRSLKMNISLQGELVGEGIHYNKLKLRGQNIYFFNAFDIDKFQYLDFSDFKNIMYELNLQTVPIIDNSVSLDNDIDVLVASATRRSLINENVWAEGIVLRPLKEKIDFTCKYFIGGRLSFKVINPEFLLKYGE